MLVASRFSQCVRAGATTLLRTAHLWSIADHRTIAERWLWILEGPSALCTPLHVGTDEPWDTDDNIAVREARRDGA